MNKQIGFMSLCSALAVFSCQSDAGKKQPNFIIIYTDDQRYDALGINGNPVIITPEMDKQASQGINFTNANVTFSLCSPSRAALLTGRYGSANGCLELNSDIHPDEITMAQYLRNYGYLTGLSGKWHLGATHDSGTQPSEAGFDFAVWFFSNGTYYGRTIFDEGETVNPEIHCDLYCARRSVDFLRDAAASGKPFFLFHNPQLPHMDGNLIWDARPETLARYDPDQMPVAPSRLDDLSGKPPYLKNVRNLIQARNYGYPDYSAIQRHTLEYYAVITEMDEFLGEIYDALEELDLADNTYVFFMSDNGWMLGEHGFTSKVLPYRPSAHVPFFVTGPDISYSENDQIVLNIDIAPTILELAGLDIPSDMHGESLVPILKGNQVEWRDAFVYEGLGTYGGAQPGLTVYDRNFRYILTYQDNSLAEVQFRELYDQTKDPFEMENLAGSSQHQDIISGFDKLIENHIDQIISRQ